MQLGDALIQHLENEGLKIAQEKQNYFGTSSFLIVSLIYSLVPAINFPNCYWQRLQLFDSDVFHI